MAIMSLSFGVALHKMCRNLSTLSMPLASRPAVPYLKERLVKFQCSTRPAESAFYSIIMIFMGNTPWADLAQLPVQEIPGPLDECYIGT